MTKKHGPTQSSNLTNGGEGVNSYDVHDIGIAAALLSLGHELITLHPDENCGCTVFHFGATTLIENDAAAYMNGKLLVNAKQYSQAFEYLGDRLYGGLHDED